MSTVTEVEVKYLQAKFQFSQTKYFVSMEECLSVDCFTLFQYKCSKEKADLKFKMHQS